MHSSEGLGMLQQQCVCAGASCGQGGDGPLPERPVQARLLPCLASPLPQACMVSLVVTPMSFARYPVAAGRSLTV